MEQDKIDHLSAFTLEELQEEIKRRKSQLKKLVKKDLKAKYYEWEGEVARIYNLHSPIFRIRFEIISDELLKRIGYNSTSFYVKSGVFNKKNMPKVGDTVILATRVRKRDNRIWVRDSKIVRIKK